MYTLIIVLIYIATLLTSLRKPFEPNQQTVNLPELLRSRNNCPVTNLQLQKEFDSDVDYFVGATFGKRATSTIKLPTDSSPNPISASTYLLVQKYAFLYSTSVFEGTLNKPSVRLVLRLAICRARYVQQ